MRFSLVFCLALGTLCGCLQQQPSPPPAPVENRAPTAAWQLRVAHSGGLLGLAQEFELDSATATIVAHDRRSNVSASRPLTQMELAELDALIAAAAAGPEQDAAPAFPSASCADCFQTELQGVYGDRKFGARGTDAATGAHDTLMTRTLQLGQPLLPRTQ